MANHFNSDVGIVIASDGNNINVEHFHSKCLLCDETNVGHTKAVCNACYKKESSDIGSMGIGILGLGLLGSLIFYAWMTQNIWTKSQSFFRYIEAVDPTQFDLARSYIFWIPVVLSFIVAYSVYTIRNNKLLFLRNSKNKNYYEDTSN